jgi:hypothetical protein
VRTLHDRGLSMYRSVYQAESTRINLQLGAYEIYTPFSHLYYVFRLGNLVIARPQDLKLSPHLHRCLRPVSNDNFLGILVRVTGDQQTVVHGNYLISSGPFPVIE